MKGVTVFALVSLLIVAPWPLWAETTAFPVNVGDRAPNFNLDVISPKANAGRAVRLYDLVGETAKEPTRLVVVSFFATWCKACKAELPILQKVQERFAKEGVRVVVLVVEGAADLAVEDLATQVRSFAAEKHLSLPFLLDPNMKDVVAQRYIGATRELPATFLVGSDGKVLGVMAGLRTDLESVVRKALGL